MELEHHVLAGGALEPSLLQLKVVDGGEHTLLQNRVVNSKYGVHLVLWLQGILQTLHQIGFVQRHIGIVHAVESDHSRRFVIPESWMVEQGVHIAGETTAVHLQHVVRHYLIGVVNRVETQLRVLGHWLVGGLGRLQKQTFERNVRLGKGFDATVQQKGAVVAALIQFAGSDASDRPPDLQCSTQECFADKNVADTVEIREVCSVAWGTENIDTLSEEPRGEFRSICDDHLPCVIDPGALDGVSLWQRHVVHSIAAWPGGSNPFLPGRAGTGQWSSRCSSRNETRRRCGGLI
jgi:hypothetical protein